MVLLSSLSFPTPHCANSMWFGRKEGSHRNTRFDFVFLSWGTPPVVRSHTDSPYQHRYRSSAQGWLNGRGPSTQKAENHRKRKGDTVKTDGRVLSAAWLSSI